MQARKKEKNLDNKVKYFLRMRAVVILALVCTVLVLGIIIIESLTPASKSAERSNAVANVVKKLFKVDETVVPKSISFNYDSIDGKYYYVGDKLKLPLETVPKNASKDFEYEFSEEGCFIDENGYFSCTRTDYIKIDVTVRSKRDKNVFETFTLNSRGLNPYDEAVEEIVTKFVDYYDQTIEYDESDLTVGRRYTLHTYLKIKEEYADDYPAENGLILAQGIPYTLKLNGEERPDLYQFDSITRDLTFLKEAEGELEFWYKKTRETYVLDFENHPQAVKRLGVSAKIDPEFDYIPKKNLVPLAPNCKVEKIDGVYVVTCPSWSEVVTVYAEPQGKNVNVMGGLAVDDSDRKKIEFKDRVTIMRLVNDGEVSLKLVSLFDESLATDIKIVFKPRVPKKLTVYSADVYSLGGEVGVSSEFDVKLLDQSKVKYTVVDGADKITYDQSSKSFKATKMGRVTMRVESVYFPELYEEFTFEIKLFTEFRLFVRKIIGHFSLFAFLGIGLGFLYLTFLKSKWLTVVLTPVSTFLIACVSEILQLPIFTQGRFAAFSDVLIDFAGSMTGFFIAALIVFAVLLIWRRLSKKTFAELLIGFSWIKPKTLFKKYDFTQNKEEDNDLDAAA